MTELNQTAYDDIAVLYSMKQSTKTAAEITDIIKKSQHDNIELHEEKRVLYLLEHTYMLGGIVTKEQDYFSLTQKGYDFLRVLEEAVEASKVIENANNEIDKLVFGLSN